MRYGFSGDLSPWVTRPLPDGAQDLPASPDCAVVRNGRLMLMMRNGPLRTGHVWIPPERLTVTYGTVRARMKFPSPVGAHSCLWLQDVVPYATPEHHEVDIAEHFGTNRIHSTVHWTDGQTFQEHFSSTRVAADWAVYECEIRPTGYTFRINGRVVGRTRVVAFPRPKTLILSLLSDEWERDRYGLSPLHLYRTYIDWVEVNQ